MHKVCKTFLFDTKMVQLLGDKSAASEGSEENKRAIWKNGQIKLCHVIYFIRVTWTKQTTKQTQKREKKLSCPASKTRKIHKML